MKHYNKLIAFIFCLTVFTVKSSAQGTYDIFPLASGMHYSYTFYQEEKNYELAYLIQINSDSGDIEYIILDSLQYGDTLKVWNIEQRRKLLHYRFWAPSWDTTYLINDTSYYQLYEYLEGKHELKCSSLVWFFPLNVWPPNHLTGPDSSIYRYSAFPNILNVLSMHDPYNNSEWEDSIWFSEEAGMYRRITETYWVSISQLHYRRYLERSDITIDVKQSDGNVVKDYILYQNYPNPFNPTTTISDFNADELTSGIYFYQLRAGDPESSLPGGQTGSGQGFVEAKKMILLK
jgi:hypothetical protein